MAAKPILAAMTADPDTDVVVFLIGMRINRWRSVRHWLPVFRAMKPMIREILSDPNSGCLSARTFLSGRTVLTVQYWRSTEQLMAYAHDAQAAHLPAWRAFNRHAARTGAVGIFHETYPIGRGGARMLPIKKGGSETLYRSMPPFGLAAATGSLTERRAPRPEARDKTGPIGCPHELAEAGAELSALAKWPQQPATRSAESTEQVVVPGSTASAAGAGHD